MEYLQSQLEVIDNTMQWYTRPKFVPEDYTATIEGFAGTGKTTIAKEIISQLLKRGVKIAVTAPTHQAKDVIAEKTGMPAETVQKLLGLRPEEDLDNFSIKKSFKQLGEPTVKNYNLVIIDEASMINKELETLLKKTAAENYTKILYLGDRYQLPPVGESLSNVFKTPNLFTLSEIVRQEKENPNVQLIDLAIKDIMHGTDNLLTYLHENPENINEYGGYKMYNKEDYFIKIAEVFKEEGVLNSVALSYTNDAAKATNNFIRKTNIGSDDLITKGEWLLGYETNNLNLSEIKQIFGSHISYKDIYTNIQPNNTTEFIPRHCPYKELGTYLQNSRRYEVLAVEKKDIEYMDTSFTIYLVHHGEPTPLVILDESSIINYRVLFNSLLTNAQRVRAWKSFYDFKNTFITFNPITNDGRVVQKRNIDYAYAITIHKSQGSTYTNVGITLSNIMKACYDKDLRRKLIYVAISRTSKYNYIYA